MLSANREQWKQRIADYKSSGQTAKVWCEANNLNINTLKYYISKFNKENKTTIEMNNTVAPTKWIKVNDFKVKKESESALDITIGKASIKVSSGFDSEILKEIVRTLSSIC